ncbi:two-component system sensor histidine kinase NtrB [Desulfolutivibrio sulfoxidireducens]|uniref:two-component system sensor histidine kinase NtrB n=1 Tax=Desulfolutivibrio sulfoxidireducens TaxID=2773299 RepID=UPI00159E0783|nr:ATP-binding protein [Desulfolutivibrio sulfoxidireducens]QLA19716.1 PAS domain S-box protein [Desulfolutivibrio sulfoxidireducens]
MERNDRAREDTPAPGDIRDLISQNVLESIPIGLLLVDRTGSITVANPAAVAILGFPASELEGKGFGQLFFENDANRLFNQIIVDIIHNEVVGLRREAPYVTPAGETLHLSLVGSFLRHMSEIAGVVLIIQDNTGLFAAQRRENELLREKNRIQEDKIRALDTLARSVAHQIRNPTLAIGGFAARLDTLLRKHGIESDYPGIILEEAARLEGIVKAVNKMSRIPSIVPEPTRLGDILDAARGKTDARAAGSAKKVRWDMEIADVQVLADPELLTMAFEEIFSNSVDFSPSPGVDIAVKASTAEGWAQILVEDLGPGVADEHRPYVFDPFFSTRPDGSGMGLALAREVIVEHGGNIALRESTVGGTTVAVTLPVPPPSR